MGKKVIEFTIPLPPISKKNSMQIVSVRIKGTGNKRPMLIPSKQYIKYEKDAAVFIPDYPTINYPVNVKCLFYMPTRRRCDLTNMLESIDDVMVKAKLLEDDNSKIIVSHDGSRVLYDKENPRTEVVIDGIDEKDLPDMWK